MNLKQYVLTAYLQLFYSVLLIVLTQTNERNWNEKKKCENIRILNRVFGSPTRTRTWI